MNKLTPAELQALAFQAVAAAYLNDPPVTRILAVIERQLELLKEQGIDVERIVRR